jgi:hypothetical protein
MATAPVTAPTPSPSAPQFLRRGIAFPVAALALIGALQFAQIFRRGINWDELWHYSQIHELAAGTLGRPLQTLHTRLFRWVIDLPGTGVDHIIIIRLFMFACEMITTGAIIALASRFANRTTAVICALAYLSFPYVFRHGYSFRFDPPAAALLMSALTILVYARLRPAAIAATGVLLGAAPMVTIKIVLYAPAFAGVLWLRWSELKFARDYLWRLAAVAAVAGIVFAAIFLLHSHGQVGAPGPQSEKIMTKAAGAMFGFKMMPYWRYAGWAVLVAPLTVALILAAPFRIARMSTSQAERIALVGLWLPVTTLIFYHNTAPYYYAFMLPPVLVACSAAVPLFVERFGQGLVTAVLLAIGLTTLATGGPVVIDRQRALLQAVETIFPHPVNYFDFCGFIGMFPKANDFLTPVGVDLYRERGDAPMRATMERRVVPLLMNDSDMFEILLGGFGNPGFAPADAQALRSNYVHFWGPYWLAGKVVRPGAAAAEEFLVPGPYTVHGAAVSVDGTRYAPGDIVPIDRGVHQVGSDSHSGARLVWGERLRAPASPPPPDPMWADF